MDTYAKELAPWEKKSEYYRTIELGRDVKTQMEAITKQTKDMISSRLASINTTIASKNIINDVANNYGYNMQSVENGMFGLRAAFEWGITDVVWLIEQNRKKLNDEVKLSYASSSQRSIDLKKEGVEAYSKGKIDEALESYLELTRSGNKDFSVYISLGIIFLFFKKEKQKALDNFNKAVEIAELKSTYYASCALLFKALAKRDLCLIEDAEKCSKQAMDLTPDFAEALYQNALYNALLNKGEIAVPLLKEAVSYDILYCLKINKEKDFDGIRPRINKMFEEIRDAKKENIRHTLREIEEKISSIVDIARSIKQQGYDVSKVLHIKLLREEVNEVSKKMKNNSIFDVQMATLSFSHLNKRVQQNVSALKKKCQEIKNHMEGKMREIGGKLLEKQKKGGIIPFIINLFIGQIAVIPIGLSMNASFGIYIGEVILFIACFYWNIILPRMKWAGVYAIQEKVDRIDKIMKKINNL